jgi:hypothetical protein
MIFGLTTSLTIELQVHTGDSLKYLLQFCQQRFTIYYTLWFLHAMPFYELGKI